MSGREVARALRAAYLALHRLTNACVAKDRVTADQFVLLSALADADAAMQQDLVRRLSSDPATVRAMVVLLERRGLVAREPHPTDGRAYCVTLTAKGRGAFKRLWAATEPVRAGLLGAFRADEMTTLAGHLRRVAQELTPSGSNGLRIARTSGHEVAMALRVAYLALHRQTNASLAKDRVTADQFVLLSALAEADAAMQQDLVRRLNSDPATVRAMVVLLERRGLVAREPHPTDGRAYCVTLTTKGRQVFRRLWAATEPVRAQLLDAFRADEITVLVKHLRRVADVMAPAVNTVCRTAV